MMDRREQSASSPCTSFCALISFGGNIALSLVSLVNLIDLYRKSELSENVFSSGVFRDTDESGQMMDKTESFATRKHLQIATLVYSILMTPLTVAMIFGLRKKKPFWITPWLIFSALGIIGISGNIIRIGYRSTGTQIFTEIIYVVVQSLIWIPLLIFWLDMRQDEKQLWERIDEQTASQSQSLPKSIEEKCTCRLQTIDE